KNSQIAVERIGDQLKLSLPNNITFPTNGYQLNDKVQKPLTDIAGVLVQFPDTSITVAGHTDSSGAAAYNQTLSEKRAQSVTEYLQGQGVNSVRVRTMGYGAAQPVASNASDSGKGAVAAMLGMISTALLGLGCSALAWLGAGAGLQAFAGWAALGAGLAAWPLWRLLKQRAYALQAA
ncbi:hypothetical protein C3F00_032820, partial [Pseudomonas sp. MWU13-2860]